MSVRTTVKNVGAFLSLESLQPPGWQNWKDIKIFQGVKIIAFTDHLKWGEASGLLWIKTFYLDKTIRTLKRINNLQCMARERYSQKTVSSKNSSQSNSLFVAINTDWKHLWKDTRFFLMQRAASDHAGQPELIQCLFYQWIEETSVPKSG